MFKEQTQCSREYQKCWTFTVYYIWQ